MAPTRSLPTELTIYTVGELRPTWLAWLADARSKPDDGSPHGVAMVVDATAVGEVDAAGVQLLQSLSNALAGERRALQLVDPSRPLRAACTALGFEALLHDTRTAGASA